MMQDLAKKIAAFFKDFSQVEVEVINVRDGPDGANALCRLPDGEYQVILDSDFSVKAYYRKKPYLKDDAENPSGDLKPEDVSCGGSLREAPCGKQESRRPVLSNSEKAVTIMIKRHPGITSSEISQSMNLKYKILSPILKKLVSEGIVTRDGEKYF
ncbi:hypothetical protein [Thermoanaerobacterium sp. DL9XJH110]|uniref:hypothetical protein n=1 Tax=Thermoanaerobacterium sp. DL9XJH110 TaxID=3386643 RepID=UPI003BB6980A